MSSVFYAQGPVDGDGVAHTTVLLMRGNHRRLSPALHGAPQRFQTWGRDSVIVDEQELQFTSPSRTLLVTSSFDTGRGYKLFNDGHSTVLGRNIHMKV